MKPNRAPTRAEPKALEGDKPPLNWDQKKSRPAPSNRGKGDASSPVDQEFANGDRGELSGRNQEQQKKVSGKP